MKIYLNRIVVVLLICFSGNFVSAQPVIAPCSAYMDSSVLNRSTSYGEEHIVSGLYSGLAQRYNSLSGTITGVRFWARVPVSVGVSQTVKVNIYLENVGFPGTLLSQTNVLVPSSNSLVQIDAVLSAPLAVNSNVIIAIEPFSVATDNVWIQHNEEGNAGNNYIGNGGNLYLNLIKQGVTWYKNLANGDPSWDYDFMILPMKTVNVTAAFNSSVNNYNASFTNMSVNASSYLWDFGDGNSSTATSPNHVYLSAGSFSVKLKAFGPDMVCNDSLVQIVNVATGLHEIDNSANEISFDFISNSVLKIEAKLKTEIKIHNIQGQMIIGCEMKPGSVQEFNLSNISPGVYFIKTNNTSQKFIKY